MSVKRYLPDGSTRTVWNDDIAEMELRQGGVPQRASRVEVVGEGPNRAKFHVDFSPLAEVTGDDRYLFCLAQTFSRYDNAVAAERMWLRQFWVMG